MRDVGSQGQGVRQAFRCQCAVRNWRDRRYAARPTVKWVCESAEQNAADQLSDRLLSGLSQPIACRPSAAVHIGMMTCDAPGGLIEGGDES
jgi:hypothetical protein